MITGLGTYAFYWRSSSRVSSPLNLPGMLARTADLGLLRFQICDYPPLESYSTDELEVVASEANRLGIALELGIRGIRAEGLATTLDRANALGAQLVRSMLFTASDRPTIDEARAELDAVLPKFEAAGVTLALETYEQVATQQLVELVESVGSERLGICLDVANTVARLENQREVIDRAAPHVKNLHVKDFQFVRAEGLVGFELTGAPLGSGLLELEYLLERVAPVSRDISMIVEHWLPWQADERETLALEQEWTARSVDVLKSYEQAHKSTG